MKIPRQNPDLPPVAMTIFTVFCDVNVTGTQLIKALAIKRNC